MNTESLVENEVTDNGRVHQSVQIRVSGHQSSQTAYENSTQPDIDLQRDETRELSSLQMQQEDASTCTSVISASPLESRSQAIETKSDETALSFETSVGEGRVISCTFVLSICVQCLLLVLLLVILRFRMCIAVAENKGNGGDVEIAEQDTVVVKTNKSINLLGSQQSEEHQDNNKTDETTDTKTVFENGSNACHESEEAQKCIISNESKLNYQCTRDIGCSTEVANLKHGDDKVTEIENIDWDLPDVKCLELCGDETETERVMNTATPDGEEVVNQECEGGKEDKGCEKQKDDNQRAKSYTDKYQSDFRQGDQTKADKDQSDGRQAEKQEENEEERQGERHKRQNHKAETEDETGNKNREEQKIFVDMTSGYEYDMQRDDKQEEEDGNDEAIGFVEVQESNTFNKFHEESHKCQQFGNNMDIDSGISEITDEAFCHFVVTIEDRSHHDQMDSKESMNEQPHKGTTETLVNSDIELHLRDELTSHSVHESVGTCAGFIPIENKHSGGVVSTCPSAPQCGSQEQQSGSVVTDDTSLTVSCPEVALDNSSKEDMTEQALESSDNVGREEDCDTYTVTCADADACRKENLTECVVPDAGQTSQNGAGSVASDNEFVEEVVYNEPSNSHPTIASNDKLLLSSLSGKVSSPYERNVMLNTLHDDVYTCENNVRCDVLLVSANADDDMSLEQISPVGISENIAEEMSMCLSPASQESPFGSEMMLLPCLGSSPFDGNNLVNKVSADELNIVGDGGNPTSLCYKSQMSPLNCDSYNVCSSDMEVEKETCEISKVKQENEIGANCNFVTDDGMNKSNENSSKHMICPQSVAIQSDSSCSDNRLRYSDSEHNLNAMTCHIASDQTPNDEQSESREVNEDEEPVKHQAVYLRNESSQSEFKEHLTAITIDQNLQVSTLQSKADALEDHQSDTELELHSQVAYDGVYSEAEHEANDVGSVSDLNISDSQYCDHQHTVDHEEHLHDKDQLVPGNQTVMEEITSMTATYETDKEDIMNELKTCVVNEDESDGLDERLPGNSWSEIDGAFEQSAAKRMKLETEKCNMATLLKLEISQDACNQQVTDQHQQYSNQSVYKPCFPQVTENTEKSACQTINRIRLRLGLSKRQRCRRLHRPNEDSMY
ncbi:uncharacterized protein LOC134183180 isoform X2 [Corticium candelabrum]|uniref:uncharacterized protein LOC134183180 isoform X2 n=1 Tax=Corticium candelabrum TaxID=121492 RepID=UPI002E26C987|nr:uncharacterized protein LOC134183180 isoform X2 [Corticium candelabrum]